MINKKYLITSGCSFTEGHLIGPDASWAKYVANTNGLKLINLAHGGVGNEIITQNVINYATLNPEIAKDSLFIIQLSECLRFLICWDSFDDDTKKEEYIKSIYWHITPMQFLDSPNANKVTADGFANWDKSFPLNKWIYDSRFQIAQLYTNVTFSLLKTYNNIINFINFCKANGYPYLIFDGLNNHIPVKKDQQYFLRDSSGQPIFQIEVHNSMDDYQFFHKNQYPVIHKSIIDLLKNNPNYYNDMTLHDFITKDKSYHINNDDHPNELGSESWAKHLQPIIEDLFGKSN